MVPCADHGFFDGGSEGGGPGGIDRGEEEGF